MVVKKGAWIVDTLLLIATVMLCIFLENNKISFIIIALFIMIISIWMCFKARHNTFLIFLLVCICLINISLSINDFINGGILTSKWQINGLRSTVYNFIGAKCIVLFTSILSLFVSGKLTEESKFAFSDLSNIRKGNSIISAGGIVILYAILLYGIWNLGKTFSVGSYTRISSTIYEYSVVIFCMIYFFSANIRLAETLLLLYAILFSVAFTIFGDRSSAFMYILAILCLYLPQKLTMARSIGIGVVGIIFSNIISIFRTIGSNISVVNIISALVQKGLYQDTVSWAYYGGLSAVALRNYVGGSYKFLFGFILSIFGIHNDYSNVVEYAEAIYPSLHNEGGGIFPLFWYSWLGWGGVVFGAIILGIILRVFFNSYNQTLYKVIIAIIIIVFCLRWYIYSPLNLFRSALLITSILYGGLFVFVSMGKQKT